MNAFVIARKAGASAAKAKEIASSAILKASVAAAAAAAPVLSFAQATDIDAKIDESGVKIVGYATAVVGIMVGFWAVKRAGQKMGWW